MIFPISTRTQEMIDKSMKEFVKRYHKPGLETNLGTIVVPKFKLKVENYPLHDSMRGHFGFELYKHMINDSNIYLVVGDLGYGMFDPHFEDIPDRCINVGAAEQAMMGVAVGLALEGKIPVVYSITSFLLYRPFETIRNYISGEGIPVKMIGSGRDKDYAHDGLSHHSHDAEDILSTLPNIVEYWPTVKERMPSVVEEMLYNNQPSFLSLRR